MHTSLIMKFIADVSSSIRRVFTPTSNASMIVLACEVLPLLLVLKFFVSLPKGRLDMKLSISTDCTERPSSDFTLKAVGSVTTNSRPSQDVGIDTLFNSIK